MGILIGDYYVLEYICICRSKRKDKSEWKPLVIPAVYDDFKYFKDDFIDDLQCMSAKDSSHPSVQNLSTGLYEGDFKVQYCTIKELRKHYFSIVEKFNTIFKTAYLALGLKADFDDDYYDIEDLYDECDNRKQCIWDKMTFHVNREIFRDLIAALYNCQKAYQVLGMCDTIESMTGDYNDEVRLIFAIL